jgi:IS5 family transposase
MVLIRRSDYQAKLLSSNDIYDKLIIGNDIFEKINEQFDFNFIYDEVEELYCSNNGRPAYDPVILYKATLVQRLKKLSDPEMEYTARYDIRIKHFLGIPIEDYSFDYSTLSVFRTRLGPELFENIFNKILQQIVNLEIIKSSKQQFLDSMPVLAHAALPSVTSLIHQGISEVICDVDEKTKEEIYSKTGLTDDKIKFYSKARPLFKMEKVEREAAFNKAVNRAKEILLVTESKNIETENTLMLKQILNENIDDNNKKIQTEKQIRTLVDKDAKIGHKTKEDIIFGYKNHATVTPEGIITAVVVTSAAEKDDKQTKEIIQKQEKANLKAEEIEADSAYGYIETYKTAKEQGVTLNAPFRGLDEKELSTYELKYNNIKKTLTCLNNITVHGYGPERLKFEFPIRRCRTCKHKDKCQLSASKRVILHKNHDIAREAIERQRKKTEEKKEAKEKGIKQASRTIVENVFAYLTKLGGKKTPYIGYKKTLIHILLVTTMSNIMKTVRIIEKRAKMTTI